MVVEEIKNDRRAHVRLDKLEDQMIIIIKAFPHQGDVVDYEGHRRSHEAMIKAAEAQERFWEELKTDILKKGIIGLLIILIGLLATGFLVKFGLWQAALK